jgi:hypothetical protein
MKKLKRMMLVALIGVLSIGTMGLVGCGSNDKNENPEQEIITGGDDKGDTTGGDNKTEDDKTDDKKDDKTDDNTQVEFRTLAEIVTILSVREQMGDWDFSVEFDSGSAIWHYRFAGNKVFHTATEHGTNAIVQKGYDIFEESTSERFRFEENTWQGVKNGALDEIDDSLLNDVVGMTKQIIKPESFDINESESCEDVRVYTLLDDKRADALQFAESIYGDEILDITLKNTKTTLEIHLETANYESQIITIALGGQTITLPQEVIDWCWEGWTPPNNGGPISANTGN